MPGELHIWKKQGAVLLNVDGRRTVEDPNRDPCCVSCDACKNRGGSPKRIVVVVSGVETCPCDLCSEGGAELCIATDNPWNRTYVCEPFGGCVYVSDTVVGHVDRHAAGSGCGDYLATDEYPGTMVVRYSEFQGQLRIEVEGIIGTFRFDIKRCDEGVSGSSENLECGTGFHEKWIGGSFTATPEY